MSKRVLAILGMHRSGTSLITQWLYRCGLNVGDSLAGSKIGNIEGHFEDNDFLHLHSDILKSHKYQRTGLITEKIGELSKYNNEKLKINLELKNRLASQWGWKEPRTCLFLSHYRKYLDNAKYIIIIRDCEAVINSLITRDIRTYEKNQLNQFHSLKINGLLKLVWNVFLKEKKTEEFYKNRAFFYCKVWMNYNEEILKHIKTIKKEDFIVINYKMLIDNSFNIFHHLKSNWQFDLEYFDYKHVYKESLISKSRNIDKYIDDKSVLIQAHKLEEELLEYEFFNNQQN